MQFRREHQKRLTIHHEFGGRSVSFQVRDG